MGKYHLSFDLWSTLVKSNPAFKSARVDFFHDNYNANGISRDAISSIFSRVGLWGNAINAKTGRSLSSEELYLLVLASMNGLDIGFSEIDLARLYDETESMFFENHPVLYDSDTASVLRALNERGHKMNLLSNTAFIKGRTLRQLLRKLEIDHYFSFQLYSDELDCSKPSREIYETLFRSISGPTGNAVDLKQIIHIGDNLLADIRGAESYGIRAIQINSNSKSIRTLLSLC